MHTVKTTIEKDGTEKPLVTKFTVPKDAVIPEGEKHPTTGAPLKVGDSYNLPFEFEAADTDADAESLMTKNEWSKVGIVNDLQKTNARSAVYQKELARFKPSTLTPEQQKERAITALLKAGVPEAIVRAQVEAMFAEVSA